MSNIDFDEIWSESKNEDLLQSQKFWDLRADEFNAIIDKKGDKDDLINYLISKDAVNIESNVLDIGCGAGKYLLEFAKVAKNITGIDISPKMISYAQSNVRNKNYNNVEFKITPWQGLNIDELQWKNKYDLVFASMTPAINSKENLIKMNEASRKVCFMSGFVYRKDSVRDELVRRIVGINNKKRYENNIYYAFNILWNMGIYPEIVYKDVEWNKKINIKQAIEMYTLLLQKYNLNNEFIKQQVEEHLEEININGEIEENINAKIAWMFWKVSK